jgi:hypothetical protein
MRAANVASERRAERRAAAFRDGSGRLTARTELRGRLPVVDLQEPCRRACGWHHYEMHIVVASAQIIPPSSKSNDQLVS